MTDPKRTLPASIPAANAELASNTSAGRGTTDVSATTVGAGDSALDTKPDARTAGATAEPKSAAANQPLPTNRDAELQKYREKQAKKQAKLEKKRKKKEQQQHAEHNDSKQSLVAPATGNSNPPQQ